MFIQQTFPLLLLWVFCRKFPELSVPKILGLFDCNEKRDKSHLSPEIYDWSKTKVQSTKKSLRFICVAKWRSNSATVTHVSEDNLAACGREIDQSTKFLRVACVIFYWCVFTLSFSSLFSFCWIDFPLVVHSTRWDNGINWRILFSIDEPLHTYPRHKHWKPPLPRQTASRKVSPLINPSFINHRTVFYCL